MSRPHTRLGQESGLELCLLGTPSLRWAGEPVALPAPKNLALLCYLAAQREPRTRRELAELLWGPDKLESVRVALHTLRDLPGSELWLATEGSLVEVRCSTDVARFEDAVRDGRYAAALDVWGEGEDVLFLRGVEPRGSDSFAVWLEEERLRLAGAHRQALRAHARALERDGAHEPALRLIERLLALDPLDESGHRAAMRLEYARRGVDGARSAFERCRRTLRVELAVEPAPETLALLRSLEQGANLGNKTAVLPAVPAEMPSLPPRLVGRQGLQDEIRSLLEPGARVLLHGFGGTGKSALAAALAAERVAAGERVLWLQAGDDDPDTLFDALARPFGARPAIARERADSKGRALARLLRDEAVTLLVLDDVWNTYSVGRIAESLPAELALLVTSRHRHPGLQRVLVGPLARRDALELLELHAGRPLAGDANAESLCDLLGDHAFAIRIAGVTMAVDMLSASDLLERLRSAPHDLELPPNLSEEDAGGIPALLHASLEALSDEAHEAFLGVGALFAPSCTPELLALCIRRGLEETEEALITLQLRGLAERAVEPGSDVVAYRLHDLAFSFAKAATGLRSHTAMRACVAYLERQHHDLDAVEAELANLLAAAQLGRQRGDEPILVGIMRLLSMGNAYFGARGYPPRAIELLAAAAEAARREGEPMMAHHLLTKLGNAFREFVGDPERALSSYEGALELAREVGDGHREAITLSLIGVVRFELGVAEADAFLADASRLAREREDDLALSHVLQNLSYVAGQRQDFETARRLCLEAVEVAERLVAGSARVEPASDRQAEVAHKLFFSLLNLGVAERRLGHSAAAAAAYRRALDLAERSTNYVWAAYALQELGELELASGERERALEHLGAALTRYRQSHARADAEALAAFMAERGLSAAGTASGEEVRSARA